MSGERRDLGGPVYLRHLHEDDIDPRYVAWFADPEVTRFLDARNITREESIAYLRAGRTSGRYFMHAICRADDERHIGNLKIGPIHPRHRTSDLVTVIGDRASWGRGFAREAIRIGVQIAFGEHNIRKMSASIDSANIASLKAYQAAGFFIEATLQDQFIFYDGTTDKVFVSCFNPDYRT